MKLVSRVRLHIKEHGAHRVVLGLHLDSHVAEEVLAWYRVWLGEHAFVSFVVFILQEVAFIFVLAPANSLFSLYCSTG